MNKLQGISTSSPCSPRVAVHAATDCFLSAGHETADECFKVVMVFFGVKSLYTNA